MKKAILPLLLLMIIGLFYAPSCVKEDPVFAVVIAEVQEELKAEYGEDIAKVKKMTIFENKMKIFMADDFAAERLTPFAKAATKSFGFRMKANKKYSQMYYVDIFQNKMIENKMKMTQIAECFFENGPDRVKVRDLGLGSGKYDIRD